MVVDEVSEVAEVGGSVGWLMRTSFLPKFSGVDDCGVVVVVVVVVVVLLLEVDVEELEVVGVLGVVDVNSGVLED